MLCEAAVFGRVRCQRLISSRQALGASLSSGLMETLQGPEIGKEAARGLGPSRTQSDQLGTVARFLKVLPYAAFLWKI